MLGSFSVGAVMKRWTVVSTWRDHAMVLAVFNDLISAMDYCMYVLEFDAKIGYTDFTFIVEGDFLNE